jgi:hypothetical protein
VSTRPRPGAGSMRSWSACAPAKMNKGNPNYLHTEKLDGAKHFAIWPLEQASQSCFGTRDWPQERPVLQCWLEFDVADLERATAILKEAGYELLVEARVYPAPRIDVIQRALRPGSGSVH